MICVKIIMDCVPSQSADNRIFAITQKQFIFITNYMKSLKKSTQKFLKSRARWNQKVQSNAINDEDVDLIVNTSILGELCYAFLHFKKPLHFQLLDVASMVEHSSNLFFEYLCLEKKYAPELYEEAHKEIVNNYQKVVNDLYKSDPTLDTFSLILLVSLLRKETKIGQTQKYTQLTSNLIANQPKEAIEAIIDLIFFETQFGLRKYPQLDDNCIKALEHVLVEATKRYDFLFVTKLLRMFSYVNAPKSKVTKKAVKFLQKFKPRKSNLTLEVVTSKGLQKLDEDNEMVKFNKEIVIAILEWTTGFRFYRDLGNM